MRSRFGLAIAATFVGLCLLVSSTTADAKFAIKACPYWTFGWFTSPEAAAYAFESTVPTCGGYPESCHPRLLGGPGSGTNYTQYDCLNTNACNFSTSGDQGEGTASSGGNYYCADSYLDSAPNPRRNAGPPPCPNCTAGDPINGGTGNKYQIETDFPRLGGLEFVRTYNSSLPSEQTSIGAQWRHNWNRTLFASPAQATVTRGDGKAYAFSAPSSGTTWIGDPDVNDRLDRLGDGTWLLTTAGNEIEAYDSSGKLTSVTSAQGDVTTLSYSDGTATGPNGATWDDAPTQAMAAGLLLRVTDFHGRSLQFHYDTRWTITKMIDPNGGVYTYKIARQSSPFTYNDQMLLSVQYPDLKKRTYLYNEPAYLTGSGNPDFALTGIIDEKGARYSTTRYDGANASSTELAGGVDRYTLTYGASAGYVDPLGTSRTNSFQVTYGVVHRNGTTQPCPGCASSSASESYSIDANGNTASKKDFSGNLTCYTFDLARNLETARTEGLDGTGTCAARQTTPATRTITTEWQPTRRLPKRIAEPLRSTTFTYQGDAGVSCAPAGASINLVCSKSVQATTDVDGSAAFAATADGAARVSAYTYNAAGQVLTVDGSRTDVTDVTTFTYYAADDLSGNYRAGDLASVTNALGHVTQFTQYDASGRLKKSIDPNGLETLLDYFPRGWLKSRQVGSGATGYEITSYDYDDNGQVTKVTMPDASFVSYTFDDAHRLTDLRDGLGNHIQYTLDNAGNRTAEQAFDTTGTLVRAHSRVIDALNRIAQDIGGTNPAAQVQQSGYDANGNMTTLTDPLHRVTEQRFDARNRLIEVRDPFNGSGAPTRYDYDRRDSLTKVTDPAGLATIYSLNGHGELLTQASPDTGNTGFTYDAASNVKTKVDARGVQSSYTYDALNRVTQISYPDETVSYAFDACSNGLGRVCSITDGAGATAFGFDLHGRVVSKAETLGTQTQTVGYAYNSAGQLATITMPSGRKVTYAYSNNRPVSVALDGQTVLDGVFYEPFGPNGGWRWGNSTAGAVNTHTRVYDKDFRATRITSDLPASGAQPYFDRQLTWDAQSRVQSITDLSNAALNPSYGYDALDRLTSTSQSGANASYAYNGVGDRLSSTFNAAGSTYAYAPATHRLQQVSGAQSRSFTFDAAGNVTGDGTKTWTFGGNGRNKQVVSGSVTTSYGVNALGQRVSKSDGTGTKTYFVYDERGHLLGEYDGTGQPIAETIWLEDLPVAVVR